MSAHKNGPQLELVSRLPVGSVGRFVLDGQRAFLIAGRELLLLDLKQPETPRVAARLPFKESLYGLALVDQVLFVSEWTRALNMVDVSDLAQPDYFDCLVQIGRVLGPVVKLGEHLVLSGGRDKRLLLIDATEPRKAQQTHELTLEQEVVDLKLGGDLLYVANDEAGLAVYGLESGQLEERGRYLAGESFKPQQVFLGQERVYLFGYGDDEDRDLWVLDRTNPETVLLACESGISSPKELVELGERAVMFHSHYSCSVMEGLEAPKRVFQQYETDDDKSYLELAEGDELDQACMCMDEISYWQLAGDLLYAAQGGEFVVYRLCPGSVLKSQTRT